MGIRKIKISQFRGRNTQTDSSNLGVGGVRQCRNFFLRPMGALSVPPAWNSFSPGGVALNLGFINNIDFLFDGARLLLESSSGEWWDVTPDPLTGSPSNTIVAYASTEITADQTFTSGQVMAFKQGSNYMQMGADAVAMGWFTYPLGAVPYYSTRYTSDRAFAFGFGPVFVDSSGNSWKYRALPGEGLDVITI